MSVVGSNVLAGASGQSAGGGGAGVSRSLRFNASDSAYLSRTPSSAGNRKTWTWSGWVKRSTLGMKVMFGHYQTGSSPYGAYIGFVSDQLTFVSNPIADVRTTRLFKDASAWYHIMVAVDTTQSTANDRVKMYVNGVRETIFSTQTNPTQNADTEINKAIEHTIGQMKPIGFYFDGYLVDVHFIDGQALAPTDFGEFNTDNLWVPKAYGGTYGTNGFNLNFADNSSAAALGTDAAGSNDWTVHNLTTGTFTSTNSSHSGSTLSNGTLTWSSTTANIPVTYSNSTIPRDKKTYIEVVNTAFSGNNPGPGVINVQNTSLGHVSNNRGVFFRYGQGTERSGGIGAFTGSYTTWTTSDVLGIAFDNTANSGAGSITFYKNGNVIQTGGSGWTSYDLYVAWSNNGTNTSSGTWNYGDTSFSYPVSGHTGFVVAAGADEDSLVDSPTNGTQTDTGAGGEVVGNYCTWNALDQKDYTLTNGNLDASSNAGGWRSCRGTIGMSSGKWYWEVTATNSTAKMIGIATSLAPIDNWAASGAYGWIYNKNGYKYHNGGYGGYGATYTTGDVIGVAFDADNGSLAFYKNGASQGTAYTGLTSGPYFPVTSLESASSISANFGARPFAHAAPSGYKSLNTANLPTPTIADGSLYFDTKLWTGNATARDITTSMSPDMVWIKKRNSTSFSTHQLFDTVRGATKALNPNDTNSENTETTQLTAFNSDGFTLGTSPTTNGNNDTFVSWNWDAGSSNTTIAAGSLNSSVYDQSRTWSNDWTGNFGGYPPADGFNGSVTTGNITVAYPSGLSGITLTVSPAISGSVIRVLYTRGNSNTAASINGTETLPVTGGSTYLWHTLTATSISSVTLTHDGAGSSYMRAIEVDGKLLVNSGVSVTNVPSIASTVRANPSAGFSIVKYTGNNTSGAQVGHGLNAAPEFIIVKQTDATKGWPVYTKAVGPGAYLSLNSDGQTAGDAVWGNVAPTNSYFTISNQSEVNGSGGSYIAYCFAPVAGYSAMGVATGTGTTDGPFIHTGFKVRFLIYKRSNGTSNWLIYDTARNPSNPGLYVLSADNTGGGNTYDAHNNQLGIDFLSNGFKIRSSNGDVNTSGASYIYYAVAENPFQANGGLAR